MLGDATVFSARTARIVVYSRELNIRAWFLGTSPIDRIMPRAADWSEIADRIGNAGLDSDSLPVSDTKPTDLASVGVADAILDDTPKESFAIPARYCIAIIFPLHAVSQEGWRLHLGRCTRETLFAAGTVEESKSWNLPIHLSQTLKKDPKLTRVLM